MRRNDRALRDFGEICSLLESCPTLRLGFCDKGEAYIVPLSFGFEACGGGFVFYVHGAREGRRHELAEKCPRVCVEADLCKGFKLTPKGAQTADYMSFIGMGEICRVSGDEARHGLELICRHCGFDGPACTDEIIAATCVEKIIVREFNAKQRFAKKQNIS